MKGEEGLRPFQDVRGLLGAARHAALLAHRVMHTAVAQATAPRGATRSGPIKGEEGLRPFQDVRIAAEAAHAEEGPYKLRHLNASQVFKMPKSIRPF